MAGPKRVVRIKRPGTASGWSCLGVIVVLVPPTYCVYAWVVGVPLRFGSHAWTVVAHAALLASALLLARMFQAQPIAELVDEGEPLILSKHAGILKPVDSWWAFALVWPAPVFGAGSLIAAASAAFADTRFGSDVSGWSGLLIWVLVLLTSGLVAAMFDPRPAWLTPFGVRTMSSLYAWDAVDAFIDDGRRVFLYPRRRGGVPMTSFRLTETSRATLVAELRERRVRSLDRHPRSFVAYCVLVSIAALALLAVAVGLQTRFDIDAYVTFGALSALGLVLTQTTEACRGVHEENTPRPRMETEAQRWARVRSELADVLDEWQHGRRTRAQVHAWAARMLDENRRPSIPPGTYSEAMVTVLLTLLAHADGAVIQWGEAGLLTTWLRAPSGHEEEALRAWRSQASLPAVGREAVRATLERWRDDAVDDGSVGHAFGVMRRSHDSGPFDDDDPRGLAVEIVRVMSGDQWDCDPARADVTVMLEFLDAPAGQERSSWARWTGYWAGLDRVARHAARAGVAARSGRSTAFVGRRRLRTLLADWRDDKIRLADVVAEVDSLTSRYGLPWLPFDEPNVVCVEVVRRLRWLRFNLTAVGDVPQMLALLDAARGAEAEAVRRWHAYWRSVDWDARAAELDGAEGYDTSLMRARLRRSRDGGEG